MKRALGYMFPAALFAVWLWVIVAAIDPMRKAAESVKPLYYRQRYNYILAQLLQRNNQLSDASASNEQIMKNGNRLAEVVTDLEQKTDRWLELSEFV
jgi:hypothetical protein